MVYIYISQKNPSNYLSVQASAKVATQHARSEDEDTRPLREQLMDWAISNPIPAGVATLMLLMMFLLAQSF